MTGGRKWEAAMHPLNKDDWWVLEHDVKDGLNDVRVVASNLTESEARDIAAIDDIKAERDDAVALLQSFTEPFDPPFGLLILQERATALLTSIKEQGDG